MFSAIPKGVEAQDAYLTASVKRTSYFNGSMSRLILRLTNGSNGSVPTMKGQGRGQSKKLSRTGYNPKGTKQKGSDKSVYRSPSVCISV